MHGGVAHVAAFKVRKRAHLGGGGHAVIELHALAKSLHVEGREPACHAGMIGLVHVRAGVQQARGQLAVGHEEQHARRVLVEPAHGEKPRVTIGGHKRGHRGAAVGVVHGGQAALGLVEHKVDVAVGQAHDAAVDRDHVHERVNLGAQLGGDLAVHADASGGHEVLGAPSACGAGTGKELLQAHGDDALFILRRLHVTRRLRSCRGRPGRVRNRRLRPRPRCRRPPGRTSWRQGAR